MKSHDQIKLERVLRVVLKKIHREKVKSGEIPNWQYPRTRSFLELATEVKAYVAEFNTEKVYISKKQEKQLQGDKDLLATAKDIFVDPIKDFDKTLAARGIFVEVLDTKEYAIMICSPFNYLHPTNTIKK
jgi:hypothetical protein